MKSCIDIPLQPLITPEQQKSLFESYYSNGFVFVENCLSADLVYYLRRASRLTVVDKPAGSYESDHVYSAEEMTFEYYKPLFAEILLDLLTPLYSAIVNKPLAPSYSMYRRCSQYDRMLAHTDRPSCQYSITCMIDSSDDKCWPFMIESLKDGIVEISNQKSGDLIFYQGEKVKHARDTLLHEWSNHVFLHWVDASDPAYAPYINDAQIHVIKP